MPSPGGIRIEILDYEPTPARTGKILMAFGQRIDPIVESPALAMTSEHMAGQIASAALGTYLLRCGRVICPPRTKRLRSEACIRRQTTIS